MSTQTKEILEWIYCIIIALILATLFRYFIGTPTIVKHSSMYPTLIENQRLWLNRWGRTTKKMPERGEIITFEEPDEIRNFGGEIDENKPKAIYKKIGKFEWFINNYLELGKRSYIKRVIALPGEHVEIKDGLVYINGNKLNEDYLVSGIATTSDGFTDFIVPDNCIFAMGDNRSHSLDCRNFGCVPLEYIESTVSIRIWPLNKWGKVK